MANSASEPLNPSLSAAPDHPWLSSGVVACACPDCGAPMAVRLWLRTADCWQCGTSIELTDEFIRQATRQAPRPAAAPTKVPPVENPIPPLPPIPHPRPVPWSPPFVPERRPAPTADWPEATSTAQSVARSLPGRWVDWWSSLPAWLLSLILHLLAMILLGLLTLDRREDESITLAVRIGPEDAVGAEFGKPDEQAYEFERPGEDDAERARHEHEFMAAKQDAEELYQGPHAPSGVQAPVADVVAALASTGPDRMFEGRDPRVRRQVLEREGGTSYTEAAVARGLRWLSTHQNRDGSWSLDGFCWSGDCQGRCNGLGDHSDTGGTSLALLPFLGAGQTHRAGIYRKTVGAGLNWLVSRQGLDGDLRGDGIGRMYAHGQSAIVLCEAYAISRDERLRLPAQLAIDYIVEAQHDQGGWRYDPGQPGDTSVLGWQLMALQSARLAGLSVPHETLARASHYLDQVQCEPTGALYGYQPGREATLPMTAEALLCRQYLGWPRNHPGLTLAASLFANEAPPDPRQPNLYYWYYAAQVLHHMGGREWRTWNDHLRAALIDMQETEGHAAGSWSPRGHSGDAHDAQSGGRIYMTSLAICTLEVYYRHLPLYRPVKVATPANL